MPLVELWFYSKYEATNFYDNIENNDNFKYFNHKAKWLGNTLFQLTANKTNAIIKYKTIAVPS